MKLIKHITSLLKKIQISLIEKGAYFLTEAIIIIVSITISLWVNNWSEDNKNEEIAQNFLKSLSRDLTHDLLEMKEDSVSISRQLQCATFIRTLNYHPEITQDSISSFLTSNATLFYTTTLISPNNGNYEAAKSAGYFRLLKNKALLNDITDLYEERFTWLTRLELEYLSYKRKNLDEWSLSQPNVDLSENSIEHKISPINPAILKIPYLQKYSFYASRSLFELRSQYTILIGHTKKILKEIEEENK